MDPVWIPDARALARSRLNAFLAELGFSDPRALHARASEDPAWFWGRAAAWLDLDWQREPIETVTGLDRSHEAEWFPGGALNLADNAVTRWIRRGHGERIALRWEAEDGTNGAMNFRELDAEVDRVAAGLRANGIGFGDRVGIQLPMVAESVVAALACAKLGAIAVLLFSGFGEAAIVARLRAAGAVALICADGFPRRGKTVGLREVIAGCVAALPELRTCIVVPLGGADVPRLPGELAWHELGGPTVDAVECPNTHPLMIAYTSGTTGVPKGITLGQTGFAVKAGTDAAWCFDVGPEDTSSWITDPGWIMGPITTLGGLIAGSAVAVYGGAVDFPDHRRLWRFAESAGVSMLGVSPTLVRTLARGGDDAIPDVPQGIRVFASSGEPWTPDAFDWLFERIGRERIPIINYSGGTEVSGAILSNTTMEPIGSCAFAGPVPGMAADVVDAEGQAVDDAVGELVLRKPSPGMPLGFWDQPGRYQRTYWSQLPGTWLHGDFAERGAGGWFIRGRSDDTMNVAGKRIGPAEIEQIVDEHPEVSESAAFGVPDPVKGESVVVFAVAGERDGLPGVLSDSVRARLGAALRPNAVHIVAELPRTRSGKILRRVIRSVYLGEQPGDLSSLDNPDVVELMREAR